MQTRHFFGLRSHSKDFRARAYKQNSKRNEEIESKSNNVTHLGRSTKLYVRSFVLRHEDRRGPLKVENQSPLPEGMKGVSVSPRSR